MTEAVEGDLVEMFARNRAAPVPDDEALAKLFGWWERHRDDYQMGGQSGAYAAMEFAGMMGSLFATIAQDRAALSDLRERFGLLDAKLIETYAALSRAERFQAVCQQIVDKYDDVNLGHEDFRVGAFAAALDAFDGPGLSRYQGSEEEKSDAN